MSVCRVAGRHRVPPSPTVVMCDVHLDQVPMMVASEVYRTRQNLIGCRSKLARGLAQREYEEAIERAIRSVQKEERSGATETP